MKKFKLITAVLASTLVLTGCGDKACEHVDSDNNHICDKCGVELPYVEKISIVGVPQGTVGIGDSFKLTANVTAKGNADKTVNWSVDKPAIGTIASDGTFKAVAPGTVSVTATSAFDSKVSAKVDIQVVNKGFDPSMYDDGYDFVEEFPEAVISEGLDTDKLFVPSELFTDGGMYFAAYDNGCFEVVYGVSLTIDYLYALADEMDADENLFYMDEDETGMFYGCKDNNYSVMLTFADNGASYFANFYIPNSLIYDDEKLTDNEDWTDAEKAVFTDNEFPILPFVQLGESYSVTFWEAEGKSPACIEIYDSFADYARQDLYMEKLVSEGWEYVPTTGSFQLKINDTEAWIVDVFYYYGTVIQLSRGALTVSEYPSEVVKAFTDSMYFFGPLVDFEAISIEGYGPAYNMYEEEGAFFVDCMYCDLQSFFDYRAALSEAGYVYLMTESSDEGIYELFEYGNLVLELAFFPSQAGSFDNGILELIFMDNSYTATFPVNGISEFVGGVMGAEVPAPEATLFALIGQPGLAELQVLGDVSAYFEKLINSNWVLDDSPYYEYGCISAYQANVALDIYPNSGFFVLDVYLIDDYFAPTSSSWPTKALAAYTNGVSNVVIPKITQSDAFFSVNPSAYDNTFILNMYNVAAEDYASVLLAKGFAVSYNDSYDEYDFSLQNVSGYVYDGSFGAVAVFTVAPYGIWPEHELEAIVAEINPESDAVIPFIPDCSKYSAGSYSGEYYLDFYPMNNSVVPSYIEKLQKMGWTVKDLGYGEYKAYSPDETIEIYLYNQYSFYEMEIYEYIPPITSWPTEQVAALVEGAGATGTLTPFVGEVTEFVLSESPRSIKVYAAEGRTATQDMADYISALFADGYYYYADGGYYAKPGDTLKVTLTDYYADYGGDPEYNLFSIKLAKLAAPAEAPAEATFPIIAVEERLAGLNVESVPVPTGHEFFYSNGITSHAAEVTVLGGNPISFAADLISAGFTLDTESSTSSVDCYKSESGTLFVDVPKAGDAYGAFTVTYTSVAVVKSIESITPNEIAQGSTPNPESFMANVTFVGETTGQVSVDSIDVDTSTLGEATAHVSAGGVNADVTVTIIEAPAPGAEWPLDEIKALLGDDDANALPVASGESFVVTGTSGDCYIAVTGGDYDAYCQQLKDAGFEEIMAGMYSNDDGLCIMLGKMSSTDFEINAYRG